MLNAGWPQGRTPYQRRRLRWRCAVEANSPPKSRPGWRRWRDQHRWDGIFRVTGLHQPSPRWFPRLAGLLFGVGLGGFFDGIVLHQILQSHHMLSSWYPINSMENLELNRFWDGVFDSATYIFVLSALFILWRSARHSHFKWSTRELAGTMLMGFGLFNLVEGVVYHQVLGLHHVNETVERSSWISWDIGFLIWGAAMVALGWVAARRS
ncbi:DUF2243 domain-containing protein [Rhizobium sp. 18T]|nr:DUF2243 domain-containing protein [Rhizobium redzepovicii]